MPNLTGLTTNFFPTPNEGFTTTTSGPVDSSSATVVPLNSVSGLTNGSIYTGLIDPGNAKERAFTGVVDTGGSQITSVKFTTGTNATHTTGATVVDYVTGTHIGQISKGILIHADQDGTLKAGAVDSTAVIGSGVVEQTNLKEKLTEYTFDFVASGCVWSGDAYGSTRVASMTSGVVYIGGVKVTVPAVTSRTFTASRDTYIDVGTDGVVDYSEVTNNAASPALASWHIRLGIIITGASNIANVGSVNQGQEDKVLPIASSVPYQTVDSLGNLICPRDPNRKILGLRQLTSDASNTATSATAINLSTPITVPTGRKISVSVNGYHFYGSTGATNNYVGIYEGASLNALTTKKQEVKEYHASAGAGTLLSSSVTYTPSSTNIWISVSLHGDAGTKTITGGANNPIVLKVELV